MQGSRGHVSDVTPRFNHNSGVAGADLAWQQLGEQYGVITRAYRPFDSPAPDNPNSVVLHQSQLLQADSLLWQAASVLGEDLEGLPTQQLNYIRKNYFQVDPAQAVFAVAKILRRADGKDPAETLAGGTRWAYHMAILCRKPVYVFDDEASTAAVPKSGTLAACTNAALKSKSARPGTKLQHSKGVIMPPQEGCCECTRHWHRYDYSMGRLVPCQGTPTVPNSFAGLGTREISAAGRSAIANVYSRTFGHDPG